MASRKQDIDLRSDTVTRPTAAMRKAMLQAEVGDDAYGEDPTVNRLEEEAAARVGMEAAIFVCSGTMGNLSSVLAHCSERGSEVIVGDESHIYQYEAGGMSVLGGVAFNVIPNSRDGLLPLDRIAKAIRFIPPAQKEAPKSAYLVSPEIAVLAELAVLWARALDQHAAVTRCICIENTHNRCGGTVLPLTYLDELHALAESKGLPVHLDGARMFNAATAAGVPIERITSRVTSVQFCLSKSQLPSGLGSAGRFHGAGPKAFIAKVRNLRKMLGGGQRQVGVLAAPGRIALDEMTLRLEEDHANAQLLAQGIAKLPQASIDLDLVHSNIVIFKVLPPLHAESVLAALKDRGVLAILFMGGIRMVTHFDVTQEDCQAALQILTELLQDEGLCNGHAASNGNGAAKGGYGQ